MGVWGLRFDSDLGLKVWGLKFTGGLVPKICVSSSIRICASKIWNPKP